MTAQWDTHRMAETGTGDWRPVPGFEDYYQVSPYGEVYSARLGRRLRPYLVKGYPTVGLKVAGGRTQVRVHRIVAQAFLGTPGPGLECGHLDGDPTNNDLTNLAWVTRSENEQHKRLHGTAGKGERAPCAKLTDEQADLIRAAAKRVLTRNELARLVGLSETQIYAILNGSAYGPVLATRGCAQ